MFCDTPPSSNPTVGGGLDCTGPDGHRISVRGLMHESTVGELIAALESIETGRQGRSDGRDDGLVIDGHRVFSDQRINVSGLRHGSQLSWVGSNRDDSPHESAVLDVVWIAGPDAGATIALSSGAHIIGRSRLVSIFCEDPALEIHHAQLVVAPDGTALLTQLCGRQHVEVDGSPALGATPIWPGQRIGVGDSVLEVRVATERPTSALPNSNPALGSWQVPFVRTARPIPSFTATPLVAPRRERQQGAAGGGLLPTVLGVAGAAVMALLFHHVMFLMFGMIGALVALGTWAVQRHGAHRSRRGAHREHEQAVCTFVEALRTQRRAARAFHVSSTPTIDRSVMLMRTGSATLWAARPGDPDHAAVSIGIGDASWTPTVSGIDADTPPEVWSQVDSASRLLGVPVRVPLGDGAVIAITGEGARTAAVARSMVLQLAATSGPSDWQLAVIAESHDEWNCLMWLGHATDSSGLARVRVPGAAGDLVTDGGVDESRHLVLVVDRPDLLAARTSPLRRLLAGTRPVAVIVLCASEREIPAIATSSLVLSRRGEARWTHDARRCALAEPVRIAGISVYAAGLAAAGIAHLIDPETSDDSVRLPRELGLIELLGPSVLADTDDGVADTVAPARRLAAAWRSAGPDPTPRAPIGIAADGVVEIDLVADGPHALVGGTTGSGKSELLRTLVVGMAARLSPDHVNFVLVDYKGGSTFDACSGLAHVVGLVTDLDDRLAARALRSLDAELRRRERCLREAGASDLAGYRVKRERRAREGDQDPDQLTPMPRLVVVIDEFAALMSQQPDFIGALLGIAQRGRSLGMHLVLATQRPSGVISDDIRANTNLRIALRVQDGADSTDVLGDGAAALLPRSIPGRAVMRLGTEEFVGFQAACCARPRNASSETGIVIERTLRNDARTDPQSASPDGSMSEVQWLVSVINTAVTLVGCAAPHRPWLHALSADIGFDASQPESLGIVDDPDHQRQVPLRWTPDMGHLLVAGAIGMGCTSSLLTIGSMLLDRGDPVELFVIDAMGDPRLRLLEQHAQCSAVVGVHERERLMRLLQVIDTARRSRKANRPGDEDECGAMVLLIDGLVALRHDLEQHDLFTQLTQLDNIIADGPSVGIAVVCTTHQLGAVPAQMLGLIGHRWVLHLADPLDAAIVGVPVTVVPRAIPGRLVIAGSCSEAQLIRFETGRVTSLQPPIAVRRVARSALRELPDRVQIAELPCGTDVDGDVVLPVAVSYSTLQPYELSVAHGDHCLVIGPSRSGRTTTLAAIAFAWHRAVSDGWIAAVAPRRSSACVGRVFTTPAALLDEMPLNERGLIIIDDAELIDDHDGRLGALILARRDGVTVVAAGRPDALRTSYGHWTAAVRRSRLGVVLASCVDIDGDLLNVALPRRVPLAARPGLAWIVADGEMHLAQVAQTEAVNAGGARACTMQPRPTDT